MSNFIFLTQIRCLYRLHYLEMHVVIPLIRVMIEIVIRVNEINDTKYKGGGGGGGGGGGSAQNLIRVYAYRKLY